ncbi:MAG TPA: hypothetical protein VIF14_04015 [Alphaproteobacteria bacterium]|jgi:hypothetical protein
MGFSEAVIFAADWLERIAASTWSIAGVIALAALVAASFALGEAGARLRWGIVRLALFGFFGGICTVVIIAVKGVPASDLAAAPQRSAERKFDAWLENTRRRAQAAPERPRPQAQVDAVERARRAAARLRELADARRELERARDDIAKTPESQRTTDQRRRDARALTGLARIDREEGRIDDALARYRGALDALGRLGDPSSKRAAVEVTLYRAEALDARDDAPAARAAYRTAIDEQRNLAEVPERERREGLADALLRYAAFEIGRHQERPARTALDEADSHYAFLSARRGTFDVLRARADLALAVGDIEGARAELAALRKLLAGPDLADLAPQADLIEARLALANGQAEEAASLFARAVRAYRIAAPGIETQGALAAALAGLAEAAFAARRIPEARASAAEAIELREKLGERARVIRALVQLALWEVGAGETVPAERALAQALGAWRAHGAGPIGAENAATIRLLCAGALRASAACKAALALETPASGR